jgi:hypothetical protein
MSLYSDTTWGITAQNEKILKYDIKKAANWYNKGNTNFTLEIDYKFLRAAPDTAKEATGKFYKTLNYSLLHDCKTGL